MNLSVVIPAKNEASGLDLTLPKIKHSMISEILVIDDGSSDETALVARSHGAKVISHPYSKGNGAAIKTGLVNAKSEFVLFMDGDGQHDMNALEAMFSKWGPDLDMLVGARSSSGQASPARGLANKIYNKLATIMVGHKVDDLTSGLRIVNRRKMMEYLYLLPNKFSYPTTITMAFFRAGYSVAYCGVDVKRRLGSSHLRPWRDGVRFLLIIFKVATLYSPLKVFFPISLIFGSSASVYYAYTYFSDGRFTNMGMLLFIAAILIFLMGLISEQITMLMYKK